MGMYSLLARQSPSKASYQFKVGCRAPVLYLASLTNVETCTHTDLIFSRILKLSQGKPKKLFTRIISVGQD